MMSKETHIHVSENAQLLARELLRHISLWISNTERDRFHISLSGGSTPRILFDLIARDYSDKYPWEMIHFWWGDERCVPPDDPDSNYGMTHRHLLQFIEIPAENVHRIRGENDPQTEAIRYGAEIRESLTSGDSIPKFDLIILGLGTDGHTASIFPHQMELLEASETCVVATHPDSGQNRVSLSGRVINQAERVAFLTTGSSKTEKYKEILERTGSYQSYPASYINPQQGELHWFVDRAAAAWE